MGTEQIEVGTFQIAIKKESGEVSPGFPRMEFLQDNLREVVALLPDGHYQWRITMTANNAIRADRTIQDYIDAGVIACPTVRCDAERPVAKDGQVSPCDRCKDGRYWNLRVELN